MAKRHEGTIFYFSVRLGHESVVMNTARLSKAKLVGTQQAETVKCIMCDNAHVLGGRRRERKKLT